MSPQMITGDLISRTVSSLWRTLWVICRSFKTHSSWRRPSFFRWFFTFSNLGMDLLSKTSCMVSWFLGRGLGVGWGASFIDLAMLPMDLEAKETNIGADFKEKYVRFFFVRGIFLWKKLGKESDEACFHEDLQLLYCELLSGNVRLFQSE